MKLVFYTTGQHLEFEPNNTPIAEAWFEFIFSEKINSSYKAGRIFNVIQADQNIFKLNNAVDTVNKFFLDHQLPDLCFEKINGINQAWLNDAHKKWVRWTTEFQSVIFSEEIKKSWENINLYIHLLEDLYAIEFSNQTINYLPKIDVKIRPEDCEYSQHDLLLSFNNLGRHQHDQWLTGSIPDDETNNYEMISTSFEYVCGFHPKNTPANPDYVKWCAENNLPVMPPYIILGNFKKDRWNVKQIMHQNISRGHKIRSYRIGIEL